eukprot:jgi/Botrbrau1/4303/Bobra.0390s0042.1
MSSGRVVEPNTVAVTKGQPEADGKPALSPVFRNVGSKDGWVGVGGTLYEMFQQSVEKFGIEPCLGYRPIKDGVAGPYVWSTYREVDGEVFSRARSPSPTHPAHLHVQLHCYVDDRCGPVSPICM